MSKLSAEVLNEIELLVRGSFLKPDAIEEEILEYFSNEPNRFSVRAAIQAVSKRIKLEMKEWPAQTDWDRLHDSFGDLANQWIISIHNGGFTQSDGYEIFLDLYENLIHQDSIIGYCFYTEQDVSSAINYREMYLAFGPSNPKDEKTNGVEIGKKIVDALGKNGLKTKWDGTFNERIKIVDFDWQRRKIRKGGAMFRGPDS